MRINPDSLKDKIAFLDPAGRAKPGQLKKVRANAAIVVIGADDLRRIFVLYCWTGRPGAVGMAKKVLEVNRDYQPRVFGCEANAMQELYAEMLQHEAKREGVKLPLVAVSQSTSVEKPFRIRTTLQPVVGYGRLFVREDMYELLQEITSFPMGQVVDRIDALASAVALVPPRSATRVRSEERESLAAYLRNSGADPRAIERRMVEWDRQHASA
jgi:hypothetical protein